MRQPRRILAVTVSATCLATAGVWARSGGLSIRRADPAALALTDKPAPLYSVRTDGYTASVYPDGRLTVGAGGTQLVRELVVFVDRKPVTLGRIAQRGDDTLVLMQGKAAGAASGGKLPDTHGVAVRFGPTALEITPAGPAAEKAKPEAKPVVSVAGLLDDEALAVRNVRTGDVDALPSRHLCSRHMFSFYGWIGPYWPEVQVTYRSGARLGVSGIHGISHYALGGRDPYTSERLQGRRGFWQLQEMGKDTKVTVAVHPPAADRALAEAPYASIRPGVPRGMFHADEPVVFHVATGEGYRPAGQWRVSWAIEDHQQRPVGKGAQTFALTASGPEGIPVTLARDAMGYFRVRFAIARADGKPSAVRTAEMSFARIRPECPKLRALDGTRGVDEEMLWANLLGMRGIRLNSSWADALRRFGRDDGTIDWDAWEKRYAARLELARKGTVRGLFSFTGADVSRDVEKRFEKICPDAEQRKKRIAEARAEYLRQLAQRAGRLGVTAWEPVNEPDLRMKPEKYIADYLRPQYARLKQGNPKANVLGGSLCGLEKHTWLRTLYRAGGGKLFDGASFHPYTGLGFQEAYRAELASWRAVQAEFGDANEGLWMTESAWHRGWGYNDYVYDRFNAFRQSEARNAVLMHLHAEGEAIGRERIYVFYLCEHGYNDFYLMHRREPTSAAIAIQVMNETLQDAHFDHEIPQPQPGWWFQLYRDNARTLAVAFTAGEDATIDLTTDARELTVTDLMGNRRTVRPEAGRISTAIGGDPTYIAAAGAKASILPDWSHLAVQPNAAIPTLGATAAASSVATPKNKPSLPPAAAICGDWTGQAGPRAVNGSRRGWEENEANRTFPDWFEVRLPKPQSVARVRVCHDYGAWERLLNTYDVQAFVDGAWRTVASVKDNHYGFVFDHRFDAVRTDRVRLLIHDVNACLFESIPWIPKLSSIRSMAVYGQPDGPAMAFFIHEMPRRRRVPPGGEVTLRFELRNATAKQVDGLVRLTLPQGLSAASSERKITLPPSGRAACEFAVKVGPDAPTGLRTVLAGFYRAGKLACPDYAPRVLYCAK